MPKQEYVLDIRFNDRIGLGYEVFSLLKGRNINLVGMEAKAHEKMSIKFECASSASIQWLINDLQEINGIHSIKVTGLMPYEERERQLTTILNSVDEGVIAVDQDGIVTHINEKAREIFYIGSENVIGVSAQTLLQKQIPIIEMLKTGQAYKLQEVKLKKNNKVLHYLTSGVPIFNKSGEVIGAVATIKDFKQVEEIISKVDRQKRFSFNEIIYQSPQMHNVIETAKMISKSTSSILIRGESGTGKELFARAIYRESNRADQPFVVINCAALPESLLESELFGYEEGAFTGASRGGKKGLFEQAHTGTLFLDEIGELSLHMQVRLLRVLQEGTIRRVGGTKEIPVDVRIIAATHRNLEEMVEKNDFREDLYYRLNVVPLNIPPLCKRKEDIPLLVNYLLRKLSRKLERPDTSIDNESMNYLMEQTWPGNVRQLENTLERMINLASGTTITIDDFHAWTALSSERPAAAPKQQDGESLSITVDLNGDIPQLKDIVSEVERKVILEVLKTHDSSRKAGRVLGISNTTVINKMKKLGIMYH
ncbi:sigma 54-interacting transcriptional regulator [Bacillus marinisedimentorum]|uniref:sigma 54-interacting transcriptional regulator n=1 Tax=Bacillus marinisedimentorum TaxID=1821260 RepID=UPI000B291F55|nr:sigma 54-interacting transcriptional regulator [Bacillus marinisedimentorum]